MALSRESILKSAKKPKVKLVDHPAVVEHFGEPVYVRVLSGRDRDSWDQGNYRWVNDKAQPDMQNRRARLVVRGLCDEDGKRLLTDADASALGEFPGDLLDLLETEIEQLNGLTKESQEALRKNSNGQSEGSGSASPAISE